MKKFEFKLRPTTLDKKQIAEAIRVPIRERFDKGVYEHFDLSKVMYWQWQDVSGTEAALPLGLSILQHSWAIDINDYPIPHKKGALGKLAKLLKTILWKLLKFYTYRLFYQQREFNSQAAHLLSLLHADYQKKFDALKSELDALSKQDS